MVNAAFVRQTNGDIGHKLQKLEGLAGMNASQIVEVETKVFVNHATKPKVRQSPPYLFFK